MLFAVDPADDFRLVAMSANAPALLAAMAYPPVTLGQSITDVLGVGFVAALGQRFAGGRLRGTAPWQSTLGRIGAPSALDVTAHAQDGLIIIELEKPHAAEDAEALEASREPQQSMVDLQEAPPDLFSLAHIAARGLGGVGARNRRIPAPWHYRRDHPQPAKDQRPE